VGSLSSTCKRFNNASSALSDVLMTCHTNPYKRCRAPCRPQRVRSGRRNQEAMDELWRAGSWPWGGREETSAARSGLQYNGQ
jgi:hypothetical protein